MELRDILPRVEMSVSKLAEMAGLHRHSVVAWMLPRTSGHRRQPSAESLLRVADALEAHQHEVRWAIEELRRMASVRAHERGATRPYAIPETVIAAARDSDRDPLTPEAQADRLIAAFLAATQGMPSSEVARATGVPENTVARIRRTPVKRLGRPLRARIADYLARAVDPVRV